MDCENSLYLAKDVSFEVEMRRSDNPIFITDEDVSLSRHPELIGSPEVIDKIREFIQDLKTKKFPLLDLTSFDENGQAYFDMHLAKDDLEALCSLLSEPSLQIRGLLKGVPPNNANERTFEKSFILADLLKRSSPYHEGIRETLFYTDTDFSGGDATVICDVILGWTTPSQKITINGNSFGKTLFRREASKDLIIVAEGGAEIKCHRVVLEGHSDALAAMVSPENGAKKLKLGIIDMPAYSEETVSHFIRYLYGLEIDSKDISVDAAVQLFKLSGMYDLTELQESVGRVLLRMGKGRYTSDNLVELYFQVKTLNNFGDLHDHILRIMLSLTKEIRACGRFREIEETDAKAAIGLVWELLDKK